MRRLFTIGVVLFLAFVQSAFAHGPTPHKIEDTITIKASPDSVWKVVKDFAAMSNWHAGVASCTGEGGSGNGATRTFILKSGGELVDSLDEYDEVAKSYSYRLVKENVDAFPVSFYSATLTVKAAGSDSEVEWTGRFYRGDTGNYPPDALDDAAAMTAMRKFFRQGLESLKAKVEAAH